MPLVDGVTLGRYRLLSRIATGGMGEVHRGVDVGWGGVERPVAVKLIAPEFARHPDFVTTFVDEAKLSYQLCHPNIVQVRDIGRVGEAADGTYFIAMEWVDGADLGTIISKLREGPKQPLPLRFCVLVALDAARGLDYAHRLRDAQGNLFHLVHRDVSPTNLLVSYEGDVKVTDFGIARWRAREAISLPGSLKGKIGYMAPEQARGEEVDARADVFALGVVLYELVTGQNPFTHGAREVEVLERVRHGRFAPPSTIVALPQGLEAIILRAMAPARAQRYASCAALREDLEGFARRESFLLSPAAFGQFVRALVQGELAGARDPALADTERHAELKKAPTPRPFDLALGAQLAALTSDDQPAPEEPARGGVTVPGKRVETAPARTVALHAVIAPPPERETPSPSSPSSPSSSGEAHVGSRSPSTSEIAEMVPRNNRRPLIAGALVVLVGAVVAVTAMMMRRSPEAPLRPAPRPMRPSTHRRPRRCRRTSRSSKARRGRWSARPRRRTRITRPRRSHSRRG